MGLIIMKHYVYLSGPIAGLTYDQSEDWRTRAKALLDSDTIKTLSPLRAKEALRSVGAITGTGQEYAHLTPLATARGIMTRDRFDTMRSTVVLVNLFGAKKVSIGTVMEIAWADAARIPIVLVMEPGNIHEHVMISEAIGYRTTSLEEACEIVERIIG